MMMCMRTNIDINDALLKEAMKYSAQRTKKGLVEEALETYVTVKSGERNRATYMDEARRLQDLLDKLALRENPSSVLRTDRNRL